MKQDLIQVVLPTPNSVKATFVSEDATVADLAEQLLSEDGQDIINTVANRYDDETTNLKFWAIQKVLGSEPNRFWSDEDLLNLTDGMYLPNFGVDKLLDISQQAY